MTTEQTQHARDSAELRRLCSERDQLREKVAEQAREIAVLKANVVTDNSMVLVNALAELERLKVQPRGVVQWPDADEIMQMAFEEGQPSDDASGYYFELEEFDLFIQRLMEEVARLNSSPVSAGDERATLSAFTAWGESIGLSPALQTVGELKAFKAGAEWKARAALSANHSEQVRHMVPEPVRDAMARRCLWLAFCWNDHNFGPAHEEARKEALKHGIDSFDAANEWLAAAPSAGSQKEQGE